MTDQSDSRPLTRPGFSGADAPALLLALPDPLLLIAADGTAYLNPAAQTALTDAAPQPGGGRVTVWTALFTPEVAGVLRGPLEAALEGQTARASVVLRPGGPVTLVTAAPAAPGPDGEARALLHLRETGAPLSVALDFMDGLGLGVAVQGHDSRILQVNPSATRILGLSEAQLSGRDSLDPAGAPFTRTACRSPATRTPPTPRCAAVRRSGTSPWASTARNPATGAGCT
ncbi:PAS domain-containing protein [Deinococcus aquaticus]|uniref:PAS domain-containing protein n=1 Tax=Deinococcus aquaticus TaxID=328692 RepID=UPI003617A2B1